MWTNENESRAYSLKGAGELGRGSGGMAHYLVTRGCHTLYRPNHSGVHSSALPPPLYRTCRLAKAAVSAP
jgi:hypothetical protein